MIWSVSFASSLLLFKGSPLYHLEGQKQHQRHPALKSHDHDCSSAFTNAERDDKRIGTSTVSSSDPKVLNVMPARAVSSRRDHLSALSRGMLCGVTISFCSSAAATGAQEVDIVSSQDGIGQIKEIEIEARRIGLNDTEEKLLKIIRGRKPNSFKPNEEENIETIIKDLISSAQGSKWQRNLLPGKWRVAYIRPGPGSGQGGGEKGLDRRIPFPELPFNESYQQFTLDSVTNIGELLGPGLRVEVGGALSEDNTDMSLTPKRFRVNITGGNLCAGNFQIKLPIKGEGIFDGVYLGEQIRIGQNLNGSGALVVQVRQ